MILNIISYCREHDIKFDTNSPLSLYSSLKIGGPADIIIFPNYDNLNELMTLIRQLNIPFFIVGGGTNLLFPDEGFRGVVINTKRLKEFANKGNSLQVGAGNSLWSLVQNCAKEGLSGIEPLSGIPGTIGGAVYGNAGAYGKEMKDVVKSVEILDNKGAIKILNNQEIGFSYRKTSLAKDDFILKIDMTLNPDDKKIIKQKVKEYLLKKKTYQPIDKASAGCVFKNPEGDSAGRLIDIAGCKGISEGDIMVSPLHANFFVNKGNGTERQFLTLVQRVRDRVYKMFKIHLELEVKVVSAIIHNKLSLMSKINLICF
ncbi:MAG: UDP-N-acetylmuramate dehydrogenase [Thermodesulfovibrionales bacterium]|nr:UDP-N-acetylmuramate dehydrogenase [Thermodesulfovibrionales bacterium]